MMFAEEYEQARREVESLERWWRIYRGHNPAPRLERLADVRMRLHAICGVMLQTKSDCASQGLHEARAVPKWDIPQFLLARAVKTTRKDDMTNAPTHREAYPAHYEHDLVGKQVEIADQNVSGTVERVVDTRFDELVILAEHGSDKAWRVDDCNDLGRPSEQDHEALNRPGS